MRHADSPRPAAVSAPEDILGESPVWSAREQALYWVDVRGRAVRRMDWQTGAVRSRLMPDLIGCVALCRDGGLIVALRTGIASLDAMSGEPRFLAEPHRGHPSMRFNDGRCDRQGRFWAGSMDDVTREPVGRLYRFDDRGLVPVLSGIRVPNSLCWSLDSRTMYFADGIEPVIWAYAFDPQAGIPGERRVFARFPGTGGIPDGATVDADGFVWCAHYGGGAVRRFAPDGRQDRVLRVPASQPTSCAFGGPGLDTLFVTSARQRLTVDQLAAQPLAGAVLTLDPDVCGVPEPEFAG